MSVQAISQMSEVFRVFGASEGVIRPHFILTGPSGSGKSFNVLQLAEQHNLNFMEVNAAQLTKEGLSGNSLSKALAPLANFGNRPTVCFIDEFDKLFISGNSNSDLAHESTNGVQNELLKCLESRTTSVFGDYGKYREINVENVLFVFAGAFNGEEDIDLDRLREMGMKTELLGRVGIVFNLEKLGLDTLEQLLIESPLLKNYLEIYDACSKTAIETVMGALKDAYENNTLGARLINTLLHQYFLNGGKLPEKIKKTTSFQRKLTLGPQRQGGCMKLVEILAKELDEWPEGAVNLTQSAVDNELYGEDETGDINLQQPLYTDSHHNEEELYPKVSKQMWEAERGQS